MIGVTPRARPILPGRIGAIGATAQGSEGVFPAGILATPN